MTVLAGVRVLAVDDNDINRAFLSDILEAAGATVEAVASGIEAIARARAARDSEPFRIALTDIEMPEMNGYQLAERLPIYALSAHDDETARAKCAAAGMQGLLTKPVDAATLYATVGKHRQA
ncbi:MAG: response regulator [Alphaproteobacteria bacterium]|nr:response regulator [Alphaproteobacteria bacterium]MBM3733197.1 response regulator [Acidimicrobiia bacterium]